MDNFCVGDPVEDIHGNIGEVVELCGQNCVLIKFEGPPNIFSYRTGPYCISLYALKPQSAFATWVKRVRKQHGA